MGDARWEDREVEYVGENYVMKSDEEMGDELGRSAVAVKRIRLRNGWSRDVKGKIPDDFEVNHPLYPCKGCEAKKERGCICERWRDWFKVAWNEATEPFRL